MKRFAIGLILLGGCTGEAPDLSDLDKCEQTVRDYAVLRDEGPADEYAQLFTEDGEFHLGRNVTKGHADLIARHKAANAANRWRHNMTDIDLMGKNGQFFGTTRFHIFAGPLSDTPAAPSREILGTYQDIFVIEAGDCKIKSRKVEIVFDKKS